MEQMKISLLVGMQNGTVTLGHGLSVSFKHILAIGPSSPRPGYLPQRNENLGSQKKSVSKCL